MASAALELIVQLRDEASSGLSAISGSLGHLGSAAATVATGALVGLGGAIIGAGVAGLSFNSSMENVTAQLNAFTKDGAKSAEILEMIKVRASQTPFAFEEMAKATASLLPASKASGVGLEDLIAQAEVLAASNPAEGLEGAAFALKEAVGGDFLSLVERFNLPKQRLNELKAEGVPALEAVQIAMGELGLDTDLVTGLANTASGRWSTFMDTLTGLAAVATKPIFDVFSGGLAQVNDWITKNQPLIDAFIAQLAQGIGNAITWIASTAIPALVAGFNTVAPVILSVVAGFLSFLAALQPIVTFVQANIIPILVGLAAMIAAVVIPAFTAWVAVAVPAAIATAVALAPVVLPILAIGAAVAFLAAAWQNNWGGIQEKTAAVWAFLQPMFQQLIAWFQQALPIAIQVVSQIWTGTLQPALQAIGAFITGTVIPALGVLANYLADNLPVAIRAASNLWTSTLLPAIQSVASFITGTVIPAISTAASWLAQNIPAAIQTAVGAFNTIAGVVSSVASAIGTGINTVVTVVQAGWNTVAFVTTAVWNSLASIVGPAVQQIVAFISPAIAQIQAGWQAGWAAVQQVTSTVLSAIQSVISAGIAFIQSIWSAGTAAVEGQTTSAWGHIQSIVQGVISAIQSAIQTGIAVITSVVTTAWQVIVAASNNDFGSIPGIISAGWEAIKGLFTAGTEAVKGIFAGLAKDVVSLGADIVSGIQAGISRAWGAFLGWIGDQVAKIPQPIRTALGMGSPSRVMAEQVGLPIVQGIVMGVENGMSLLTGTMTKVGVDITNSAKGAIGGVASAFQNNKLPEAAAAAGRDIIAGWMGGMRENFSGVTEAAAGMGEAVISSLKGTFEIGSPSQLMSREIGIPIVDGITAGINIASPKLSERMLQLGTMLVDLVSKGVDAFGKLRGLGTISMSSITQFANTLQSAMTAFGQMTLRWDKAMMSAASQFTRKSGDVIDLMSKGVEMLAKLKDFEEVPADVFRSFSTALERAILEIVRISTFANRQLLTHAQSFSEGAIKVIAVIGVGVDALTKLSTLAAPTQGAFLNFSNQVSYLVFRMGQAGAAMSVDTVAAAAQFAEGAGKVLGLLGTGVDGLMKLQDLTAPLPGTFLRFSEMVGFLVLRMGQVASQFDADAVAAAAKFAEGAGKIIAIVGSGVDAFIKLKDFGPVSEEALGHFVNAVNFITRQFTLIASTFEAGAVAAAGLFAESAGKVVATIGAGVEGFTKLADFQAVGEEAMGHFVNGVRFMVQQFTVIATLFSADAMAAAGVFADGAGKVLAIVGGGVDAFVKLEGFVQPAWDFIGSFGIALKQIVDMFILLASYFATTSLEAAGVFADAAGKVVAIVAAGVDAFGKLEGFTQPAWDYIGSFGVALKQIVDMFITLASYFSVASLEAATIFADAAGKVVGIVGAGVDAFVKLDGFIQPAWDFIGSFGIALKQIVDMFVILASYFSVSALEAATTFAESAGKIVSLIGTGVDGLIKLADFKGITAAALSLFAQSVRMMLDTILHVASLFTVEAINAAIAFAEGVNRTVKIIIDALDTFAKLGDFQGVAGGILSAFTSGLGSMLNELQRQAFPATVNIGQQMMLGIANGITAYQGAVVNAMINAVWAAVRAAQNALGIASPSKVFEQMIGAQVGAGMAQGIVGSTPQVVGATQGLAGAMITGGAGGGGSNRTVNVTFGSGSIVIQSVPGENTEVLANKVMDIVVQKMQTVLA